MTYCYHGFGIHTAVPLLSLRRQRETAAGKQERRVQDGRGGGHCDEKKERDSTGENLREIHDVGMF